MKISNKFKKLLVFLLLPVTVCVFSACTPAVGKSAYELAVEQGFNGNLDEWLESLKGANGTNGTNGTNGINAPQEDSYTLWQKAIAEGYTGSYLDFVKELSITNDIVAATNQAMRSMVTITAGNSGGSGVIFSIDSNYNAFIITNYHVVYGHGNIYVNVLNGKKTNNYPAELVGASATYDIAILYVENCLLFQEFNSIAATINTNDVVVGTSCFAIGNTNLKGLSVTKGIVSVASEPQTLSVADTSTSHRLIRHDAYISNGNSGGGLFNNSGELIGITNGGLKDSPLANFAIPSSIVYGITHNIIKNCFNQDSTSAYVCSLGLTFKDNSSTTFNDETNLIEKTDELKINSVSPNSPFYETIQQNDKLKSITITIDSVETTINVTNIDNVKDLILQMTSGDSIELTFERFGSPDITVSAVFDDLNPTNID